MSRKKQCAPYRLGEALEEILVAATTMLVEARQVERDNSSQWREYNTAVDALAKALGLPKEAQ